MKVSVIIPVYNAVHFLDKSIQSALDQRQTSEVLLIDDTSTDGSWEKCMKWKGKDRRVKLYKNEGIKGAGAARNVGLLNATCAYIAFLDADDYYLDGRFEEDEIQFKNNLNIDVIANSLTILNESKIITSGLNSIYSNNKVIGYNPSFSKININHIGNGNSFSIIGLTIKREVFTTVGYFDESMKQCQDTDLNIRLILMSNIYSGNYGKPVVVYYRHDTNSTMNMPEAVYYRRKAAKKHFHLAIRHKVKPLLILKFFKDFMEYDFLWVYGKNHRLKKYMKITLIPFFLLRIFSKNDPEYDKDRKILLS